MQVRHECGACRWQARTTAPPGAHKAHEEDADAQAHSTVSTPAHPSRRLRARCQATDRAHAVLEATPRVCKKVFGCGAVGVPCASHREAAGLMAWPAEGGLYSAGTHLQNWRYCSSAAYSCTRTGCTRRDSASSSSSSRSSSWHLRGAHACVQGAHVVLVACAGRAHVCREHATLQGWTHCAACITTAPGQVHGHARPGSKRACTAAPFWANPLTPCPTTTAHLCAHAQAGGRQAHRHTQARHHASEMQAPAHRCMQEHAAHTQHTQPHTQHAHSTRRHALRACKPYIIPKCPLAPRTRGAPVLGQADPRIGPWTRSRPLAPAHAMHVMWPCTCWCVPDHFDCGPTRIGSLHAHAGKQHSKAAACTQIWGLNSKGNKPACRPACMCACVCVCMSVLCTRVCACMRTHARVK